MEIKKIYYTAHIIQRNCSQKKILFSNKLSISIYKRRLSSINVLIWLFFLRV